MAKIIIGTGLIFLLLTWWAVIDISKKNFGSTAAKAIWGFTALVPFIGPVIYFAVGYRKGKRIQLENPESAVLNKIDGR